MKGRLALRNTRRAWPVDLRLFRRIGRWLLEEQLGIGSYEVGVRFVGTAEMAVANEKYLQHSGSTDVITFVNEGHSGTLLSGDILVCLDEAARFAQQYRTTWQEESVRYFIHGILHLLGFDDQDPASRRRMKRKEQRLLLATMRSFPVRSLGGFAPSV
jgi:probable rRNA maturation factor